MLYNIFARTVSVRCCNFNKHQIDSELERQPLDCTLIPEIYVAVRLNQMIGTYPRVA
jgi:hypothetical protein